MNFVKHGPPKFLIVQAFLEIQHMLQPRFRGCCSPFNATSSHIHVYGIC